MKPSHQLGVMATGGMLLLASSLPAFGQVAWRSGAVPRSATFQAEAIGTLVEQAQPGSAGRVVVQFDEPVTPELRASLEDAGLTLESYLGNRAFFAKVAPTGVQQAHLAAIPSLIDAQPVRTAWKLHPALARGETPQWAVVPALESVDDQVQDDAWIAVYVVFHDGVDDDEGTEAVESVGGLVVRRLQTMNGVVIELSLESVETLAALDAVMYLEPALPALGETNAENRALTGANVVQAAPYGLDGSGVTVMVYDGGSVSETHVDFGGRVTNMDGAPVGTHATHVAGTIGGDGTASGGFDRGMAPGVTLLSYAFGSSLPQGLTFYTDPGDIEQDFADAMANGAKVGNASLALNTSI
ncbi:MAG: hypothetical protein GY778_20385, partial [bacterium]|nr:hypothetical protein [bacterium]